MNNNFPTPKKQRGLVLVFSLIILLILTTFGVSVVQTTTLEEKMAAATRNKDMAFQAAEAALVAAELYIKNTNFTATQFSDDCTNGLCTVASSGAPRWDIQSNWAKSREVDMTKTDIKVAQQPKYLIEYLKTVTGDNLMLKNYGENASESAVTYYRITAIGYGATKDANVMLQSTYGK